jgi:hypothetical protein
VFYCQNRSSLAGSAPNPDDFGFKDYSFSYDPFGLSPPFQVPSFLTSEFDTFSEIPQDASAVTQYALHSDQTLDEVLIFQPQTTTTPRDAVRNHALRSSLNSRC